MKKAEMSFTNGAETYEMVGYVSGFVVAENEWGQRFIAECPEEFYFPGEQMESENLIPVSSLPAEEQQKFLDDFQHGKEGK